MNILDPLLVIRVIFILGFVNLVTGTVIFFSCRCLPGSRLGTRLMKYRGTSTFTSTIVISGGYSGPR